MSYTAKSVVMDIETTHGYARTYFRQMDFKLSGSKITVADSDITVYGVYYGSYADYHPKWAFITSTSYIGVKEYNGFYSGGAVPLRIICVFDTATEFDAITINNGHSNGGSTDRGVNAVKITISDDTITDLTYDAAVANSTVIYDSTFDEHVSSNVQDDQILSLIGSESTDLIDMALDIKAYQDSAQDIKSDLVLATYGVEDAKMGLSAYLQHISDLKSDLSLYGSIFQNMILDALVASTIKEDIKTDLVMYFQGIGDTKLDLKTFQSIIEHLPLDLYLAIEIKEDGKLDFSTAYVMLEDLKQFMELSQAIIDGDAFLDFAVGDGIIFKDNKMDLNIGDGNKKENVGLSLVLVRPVPIFKAIYALHLESAVKEII